LRTVLTTTNLFGQPVAYAADPMSPTAVKVTARMPKDLKPGAMATTGEGLAARRATNLYKGTTAAGTQVVLLPVPILRSGLSSSSPSGVRPFGYMAPASGKFADGRPIDTSVTPGMTMGSVAARNALLSMPKAGDAFVTVYASDQSGSMNHGYSVAAK